MNAAGYIVILVLAGIGYTTSAIAFRFGWMLVFAAIGFGFAAHAVIEWSLP